jgi:hypothetical protein
MATVTGAVIHVMKFHDPAAGNDVDADNFGMAARNAWG